MPTPFLDKVDSFRTRSNKSTFFRQRKIETASLMTSMLTSMLTPMLTSMARVVGPYISWGTGLEWGELLSKTMG